MVQSSKVPEKRILLSVPHMGGTEFKYVQEAFNSNWLSTVGPNLTALEHEFSTIAGLPSVALASGTAGIHLGLKLLGVKAGNEVVTPTLTFAASCNPILYEHAVPVFIDSERSGFHPPESTELAVSMLIEWYRSSSQNPGNKPPEAT